MKFFLILALIANFINCDKKKKILVLFFSRPGENYNVGNVDVGNTERFINKMKKILPKSTVYHKIEPVTEYPVPYDEVLKVAREELNEELRPEIKNPITDLSEYNPIILGYPIWYSEVPRIVINQMELIKEEEFKDKDIILITTHEGSGFSSTQGRLKLIIKNAKSLIEGKTINGCEVDSKTDEIESFAQSIVKNYYNDDDPYNNDL